jgi:GH35 family endo-1,4-beta-xylanase
MNRRAFLKASTGAAVGLLSTSALCAGKKHGETSDEDILAQASERIEKHRKGQGNIAVRDARGRPVPGAKVTIEQLRHDFLFGCNLFQFGRCDNREHEEQYRTRFAALLNYATLPFYWQTFEPQPGHPDYQSIDQVVEWARAQGIARKGHPLVWDHPAGSPRWLPEDQKEMERLSDARVRDIVARYQGRISIWDLVNEATHLPDHANKTKMAEWGAAMGPVSYTSQPLKIARRANPQALLLVNDYRTDRAYYNLLNGLKAYGTYLFNVIGIQSHMHDEVWALEKAWDICDTFSRLDRVIHFTETTILSGPRNGPGENWGETTHAGEAEQADRTAKFYRTLFAHPAVEAITWWDFSDYHAWQAAPAGWLRKDMSPKPVYERLLHLIKGQWWTRTDGETGPRGNFVTRAFYGQHRVTVQLPNQGPISQIVHWERGLPNHFAFRLKI